MDISLLHETRGSVKGAIATVTAIRLITDKAGSLLGSLFLPDPTIPSAPSFSTGTKTFTLSSSPVNSTISGFTDSSGEATFTSSGTLQTVESSTLRTRNADVQRIPQSDDRTLSDTSTRLTIQNTFANRSTTQTRWVDPLAQSFEVQTSMVYSLLSVMYISQRKIQTNYLSHFK